MLEEKNNLLIKLDDFEESIKQIDTLTKQYNEIKNNIKKAMVQIGKENDLEQVKWTTPKGTQITCSIGHTAEIQKVPRKFFDEEYLKRQYPNIYEECCRNIEESVIVKNATNDTLRITLPKEKKNE